MPLAPTSPASRRPLQPRFPGHAAQAAAAGAALDVTRPSAAARQGRQSLTDLLISLYICVLISTCLFLSMSRFQHWFIVPVTACGVAIGWDAVTWARGRMNVFDPVGIIGLLGFHFFYLAPLLHVYWNLWLLWIVPPPEWRPWLGKMALLNFVGLLLYRLVRSIRWEHSHRAERRLVAWRLNPEAVVRVLLPALLLSAIVQAVLYVRTGGIIGYLDASRDQETFQGWGWLTMLAQSFPILAFIGYAIWARANPRRRTWLIIALALAIFFVLRMLFGGLSGSRSTTIWALFWAVGIVHLWIRPIPKKLVLAGIAFVVAFMYLYGFVKNFGPQGIQAFTNAEARTSFEEESGKSVQATLLLDLGRSANQAYLLYRLTSPTSDVLHDYAWGRSYVGAAALFVPHRIWPNRPLTKQRYVTDVLAGRGAYAAGVRSSWAVGIAGEALVNFGPLGVVLSFLPFALLIMWVRQRLYVWDAVDSRMLLMPLLINLCFAVLTLDSDNILFFIMKNGVLPFTVIALSSRKIPIPAVSRNGAS